MPQLPKTLAKVEQGAKGYTAEGFEEAKCVLWPDRYMIPMQITTPFGDAVRP